MMLWFAITCVAIGLCFVRIERHQTMLKADILVALSLLPPHAYGVTLRTYIEEKTRRRVTVGALYSAIESLENEGLIRGYVLPGGAERGYRNRRCFELLPDGHAMIENALANP